VNRRRVVAREQLDVAQHRARFDIDLDGIQRDRRMSLELLLKILVQTLLQLAKSLGCRQGRALGRSQPNAVAHDDR
jgi:hypothetical protein